MSGSALPHPVPAPRRAVPADDRLRLHHHQGGTPAGPIPGEPRPEETVGWLRSSARALTGQHGELLPQGPVLEILLLLLEEVDDQLLLSDPKEPGERGECSIVVRQAELLEVSPRVRRVVHDRTGREAQRRAGSGVGSTSATR